MLQVNSLQHATPSYVIEPQSLSRPQSYNACLILLCLSVYKCNQCNNMACRHSRQHRVEGEVIAAATKANIPIVTNNFANDAAIIFKYIVIRLCCITCTKRLVEVRKARKRYCFQKRTLFDGISLPLRTYNDEN